MRLHVPLILAALVIAMGCNSTKWVPPNERLLVHNEITVEEGTLNVEELNSILKQKPNKPVLGRPLYLYLYNLRDPEKVIRKRASKDSLCALDNEERKLKGKRLKECDHSLRGRNGEPPVLLDSSLVRRTTEQLRSYAFKEGWFEAEVSDTVRLVRRRWPWKGWTDKPYRKPKANVQYVIKPGRAWTICTVDPRVDDPTMAAFIRGDSANMLVKPGDRFDGDVIDEERARIAAMLRIEGYLYFTKDMVIFDADSSAGDHQVDLVLRLERPLATSQRGLKGTPEGTVYHVNEVFIDASKRTKAEMLLPYDTVRYDGFSLLYKGRKPEFRPRPLTGAVLMKPETRFNQNDADRTFRRLTNLRVFDRVDITFDTLGLPKGYVNARLDLVPSKRQGFAAEGFLTNRGGFLGTSVSFNYRHKNVFRSMMSVQTSITFGFEAQQALSAQTASEDAGTSVRRSDLVNTVEVGPEVKIFFPVRAGSAKSGGARFNVNALYNYQRRPDYTRTLVKGAMGWEINSTATQVVGFYPLELNVIRIPKRSQAFDDFLIESNDPILTNSYTDHIIVNIPRVTWTLNTSAAGKRRNAHFVRITGDWAGTVVRWAQQLAGRPTVLDTATGEHYLTLANVRYAEYVKVDLDYRFYHTIHDRSNMAFRAAFGAAKPFGNQTVMPFETSFFTGGANSIRAWRARSLGPGSYTSTTNNFDRVGEMRIEGNVEYRFKLVGYLEGALFADMGNIWFLQENQAKPGSQFKLDSFLGEIAVGTGVGARLNFDFFLVRFDLGLQTKDPSLPAGQRWIFDPKDAGLETTFSNKLNFNLGIGYPF